ncbi:MAG: type II toxin-antitoxin system RelE family toxin [Planctomycetota bacterium]|jgi:mRNA interferase RelE/StbE
MERYELLIKPSAVREIERIETKRERQRVVRRIGSLAEDPRPPGCEKLTGREQYRVRQGSHRVVYAVDDDARTVLVVKVGHRRDVYR